MEPAADGSSAAPLVATVPTKKLPTSDHVWLWIFLGVWVVSFFLPAARLDALGQGKTAHRWHSVETSLVLSFVPVKGMWFIFFPHVWLVWINLFMLIAPFEIKRAERGVGRFYADVLLDRRGHTRDPRLHSILSGPGWSRVASDCQVLTCGSSP